MGWWNKKKETDESNTGSQALVAQDPRTRVKTTSAATETTNTAVQNATIFNSNMNTVTYQSTRQTVTHTQRARVTEISTRRTPTNEELEELFAKMKMGGGAGTSSSSSTTSNTRTRPPSLNGISARSATTFKPNSASPISPLAYKFEFGPESAAGGKRNSTLVKTEQTTVSQKNGRTVTQRVETERVPLRAWPPTSASGTKAKTTTTTTSTATPKPYVSPYASQQRAITSSTKPYVSAYASSTEAIPKATTTAPSACDARGIEKPTPLTMPTTLKALSKAKQKPALVYIFDQQKFDTQNEFRSGSDADVRTLRETFKLFNCKLETITNATVATVRSTVRKLETKDFSNRSALVIVIMSHGARYDRISARDADFSLNDDILFPILRNRSLNNKPKLLFVQACKGSMERGGFSTDAAQPFGSPNEILKCYSTFEGYVSYRTDDGSPFIQTLCETLKLSGKTKDIETIMQDVRRVVKNQTRDGQIPSVTSSLTEKYFFGDYV